MDEDRFDAGGHRLDEDQSRLQDAAAPLGFELRQPRKRPLEEYALTAFEAPSEVLARVSGEVQGARVELFEYDWATPGTKGSVTRGRRVVAVLRHPAIAGNATCVWNRHQSIPAQILQAVLALIAFATLFWILIPVWAIWFFQGKRIFGKDWKVGDATFDKRFMVDGPSLADAQSALPTSVQALAVREDLRGPLEIKPGLFAFDVGAARLDADALERAVRLTKEIIDGFDPMPAQRGLAYRVAAADVGSVAPPEVEALDDPSPAATKASGRR